MDAARVVQAITEAFGDSPQKVVQQEKWADTIGRLRDSIIAIKYAPETDGSHLEPFSRQLRDSEIIAICASNAQFPKDAAELQVHRSQAFALPAFCVPLGPALSTVKFNEEVGGKYGDFIKARQTSIQGLLKDYQIYQKAIDELIAVPKEHFEMDRPQDADGVAVNPQFSMENFQGRRLNFLQSIADISVKQASRTIDNNPSIDPTIFQDIGGARAATLFADKVLTNEHELLSVGLNKLAQTQTVFKSLKPSALDLLGGSTKDLLKQRGLIKNQPLDIIVNQLEGGLGSISRKLDLVSMEPSRVSYARVGDGFVKIRQPTESIFSKIRGGYPIGFESDFEWPIVPSVPRTHGRIETVGVADLLLIKQQLKRYEGADIAHIENVLKGEAKYSEFNSRRTTEMTITTEEESSSSEERSLESTTRYEMSRETEAVVKEDSSLKAGGSITAGYGPFVQVSASIEGATSSSKEEATKAGTVFAKDITEKASQNIAKRVLQKSTLTTTTEVSNKDTHSIKNEAGTGHISGVYQWVNKVYEAQMWNYGVRAMYEFNIPEPAALLIHMMNRRHSSSTVLEKPLDFNLSPLDITPATYPAYMRDYGASDIRPPPPYFKTYSWVQVDGQGNKDPSVNFVKAANLVLDPGYEAIWTRISVQLAYWIGGSNSFDVAVGGVQTRFSSADGLRGFDMDGTQGNIGIVISTLNISRFAVAIIVYARRMDGALEAWRNETFGKLRAAHAAQMAEYEEKLAQLRLQAGIAIRGTNPDSNLRSIKAELKRQCISCMTEQNFELFDSVQELYGQPPTINFAEARKEGAYVQFFEQAFEWENMSWILYPYFWSRTHTWPDRLSYDDPDPLFNDFLQAGFARVQVPARLGFHSAIAHFMETGNVWNGGELPVVGSPLYIRIADEIAERLQRTERETPQGPSWPVQIPTTLVHLRPDDKLPRWKPDPADPGRWVEDDGDDA